VDPDLRRTAGAEAQGADRFERAGRFVARAREIDSHCAWKLVDVPGVGHDWAEMALAAQSHWDREVAAHRMVARAGG
jgi:hypothetical protein